MDVISIIMNTINKVFCFKSSIVIDYNDISSPLSVFTSGLFTFIQQNTHNSCKHKTVNPIEDYYNQ